MNSHVLHALFPFEILPLYTLECADTYGGLLYYGPTILIHKLKCVKIMGRALGNVNRSFAITQKILSIIAVKSSRVSELSTDSIIYLIEVHVLYLPEHNIAICS